MEVKCIKRVYFLQIFYSSTLAQLKDTCEKLCEWNFFNLIILGVLIHL